MPGPTASITRPILCVGQFVSRLWRTDWQRIIPIFLKIAHLPEKQFQPEVTKAHVKAAALDWKLMIKTVPVSGVKLYHRDVKAEGARIGAKFVAMETTIFN